jgi:hypothetical protein
MLVALRVKMGDGKNKEKLGSPKGPEDISFDNVF